MARSGHAGAAVEEAAELRVVLARLHRQLRARSGHDITPSQASALARIEQCGPLRLGTLAEAEGTTPATLSRVIDSLAQRGLIERFTDPVDGRASLVRLSEEGGALLADLRARSTAALRTALGCLSEAERGVLQRALPVLGTLTDLLQGGGDDITHVAVTVGDHGTTS